MKAACIASAGLLNDLRSSVEGEALGITFMMRILGYACFKCSMYMPESC